MKKAAGGIPRYRKTQAPALFSQGYRPFFFGCAVWAVISITIWLTILAGGLNGPAVFDPIAWHAHEMIYGFAVAAMAGFLLTAIPNWTGNMPLQGLPLALLFLLWCAGRAAMAMSWSVGALPTALIDLSFLAVFLSAAAREIFAGRNWRNLPALAALFLMLIGNGLTHLNQAGLTTNGLGIRLGLAVLVGMIALVGGRIIPSFTRNRLVKMGAARLPAPIGGLDTVGMAIVVVALTGWVIDVSGALEGVLLVAAGAISAMRLARWHDRSIWRDALIAALNLGYAWLSFGLVLLGLSQASSSIPEMAALHALGAGAAGTMILAVMTRAILAYTSNRQTVGAPIVAPFALAHLAVALRVAAAVLPDAQLILVGASGAAWIIAFGMFTLILGPRLFRVKNR